MGSSKTSRYEDKRPEVSIGLPVYNGEKYVAETIESVLSQSFTDLELIICDNASTDSTGGICAEYALKDPRIRYVRNDSNVGAAPNFNRAFELSRGRYFKWIASDCSIKPQFIARCLEVLESDPGAVLAVSQFMWYSEFTGATKPCSVSLELTHSEAHRRFARLLRAGFGGKMPIWGLMRSETLAKTSLIRSFIGSDDCLLIELALRGCFRVVPEYLALVRRHAASYSDMKESNEGLEGSGEARWLDPANQGAVYLPHWRRLWEYLRLAAISQESIGARLSMAGTVLYFTAFNWRKILIKELAYSTGLGWFYASLKKCKKTLCPQLAKHNINSNRSL